MRIETRYVTTDDKEFKTTIAAANYVKDKTLTDLHTLTRKFATDNVIPGFLGNYGSTMTEFVFNHMERLREIIDFYYANKNAPSESERDS